MSDNQSYKLELPPPDDRPVSTWACLAVYRIWQPTHHPHWQWYQLSVVHLRDHPDLPPADFQYPGATHEIQVCAVDPDHNEAMRDRVYDPDVVYILMPPNVAIQITSPDDAAPVTITDWIYRTSNTWFWEPSGIGGAMAEWRRKIAWAIQQIKIGAPL